MPLPAIEKLLRLIVIEEPARPRPSALMATCAQAIASLPVMRVFEEMQDAAVEHDRLRAGTTSTLSSIVSAAASRNAVWSSPSSRGAVGSLARMPIGAKMTFSRIDAPATTPCSAIAEPRAVGAAEHRDQRAGAAPGPAPSATLIAGSRPSDRIARFSMRHGEAVLQTTKRAAGG